jgi:hypothetical protein
MACGASFRIEIDSTITLRSFIDLSSAGGGCRGNASDRSPGENSPVSHQSRHAGLIYLIGRRFADREVALGQWRQLSPGRLSLKSIEFRPDVLWSCLWFLTIFILATRGEELSIKKFFFAGVTLGAALCASVKTTFLVPALALGWIAAWFLCTDLRRHFGSSRSHGALAPRPALIVPRRFSDG